MDIIARLSEQDIEDIARKVVEVLQPHLDKGASKEDPLFDVKGLAEYLQVNTQWVYQKVHEKKIPFFKAGKYPRFRKSEVDAWLVKRKK